MGASKCDGKYMEFICFAAGVLYSFFSTFGKLALNFLSDVHFKTFLFCENFDSGLQFWIWIYSYTVIGFGACDMKKICFKRTNCIFVPRWKFFQRFFRFERTYNKLCHVSTVPARIFKLHFKQFLIYVFPKRLVSCGMKKIKIHVRCEFSLPTSKVVAQ